MIALPTMFYSNHITGGERMPQQFRARLKANVHVNNLVEEPRLFCRLQLCSQASSNKV